jgi:outer membrane receptor for ferrienterochelin and colicin
MKRLLSKMGLFCLATLMVFSANAQSASTISGTVKNANTSETLSSVTVTVKGGTAGTFTDDKGNFKLSVTKFPVTLLISSVGFDSKEVVVSNAKANVAVSLTQGYVLGSDVVVSASRVAERILESPVSIERVNNAQIRATASSSYYDMLANVKGVDVVGASLTFKSISTRGFNGSGNTRMNQLIDGMDNQAPGLNFSVGTMVGLTELDVDNMELLPGASSALYGSGGMNGTVLINSKNPFKYQGLSFQIKQGVNHIDNYERPQAAYKDYTVRWASKIGDRWAYKISAQYTEAQDWLAMNTSNYSRNTGTANGQAISGTRFTDPNYDGVNVYGDETSSSLSGIYSSVKAGVLGALTAAYGGNATLANGAFAQLYGAAQAGPYSGNLATYSAFLKGANASLAPYAPYLYGDAKGMFTGVNVSRTGYNEVDIIDPVAKNLKVSGSLHYKINDNTEASASMYTGSGNTVYTGSDRYSLNGLNMTQLKLEIKSKNWFARAYQTLEDAGNSYNATITTRLFNEAWKSSTVWYPTYTAAYVQYKDAGLGINEAAAAARAVADAGRPTGNIGSTQLFKSIANIPISQGGGRFLDKSSLNVIEAQYNLTDVLGLDKYDASLLVGGSIKGYVLNSQGTLFADTTRRIWINENGSYAQLSKKFFGDILKLSVSGRYDKNDNFAGRFTPRATAVVKIAEDNNIRLSYQEAYRFPTTQNQWINLLVGGGTRLMGGLPQLRNYYNFNTNPAYSLASVLAGAPVQQQFGEFKPESMSSFEVGYKTLINKKLLLDFYAYAGKYTNFISGVTVLQSRNAANPQLSDLLDASKRIAYSISTNAPGDVYTSGWGISADYLLPNNFSFSSSVYTDEIGNLPSGFISYFNTPLFRANFALNNSGFLFKNRLGFSANLHYQDDFVYEGTFAVGKVASFNTIDAVLTYKVPSIKSMIKVGGTNILNHYYQTAYGSPTVGGLYYVSFAYNIL